MGEQCYEIIITENKNLLYFIELFHKSIIEPLNISIPVDSCLYSFCFNFKHFSLWKETAYL